MGRRSGVERGTRRRFIKFWQANRLRRGDIVGIVHKGGIVDQLEYVVKSVISSDHKAGPEDPFDRDADAIVYLKTPDEGALKVNYSYVLVSPELYKKLQKRTPILFP